MRSEATISLLKIGIKIFLLTFFSVFLSTTYLYAQSEKDTTSITVKEQRNIDKQKKRSSRDSTAAIEAKLDSINDQNTNGVDSTVVTLVNSENAGDKFTTDSLDRHNEVSPLDIQSDRGIFILSHDHLMQLRILGSVRTLLTYNDRDLSSKTAFNPYETPTKGAVNSPNFYMGASLSRFGFEVTRRTKKAGDIFIRLEMDFNGPNGAFRIRHAYGQFSHLIIGQTWSLFSNVSFMPATVNNGGPIGSSKIRTPQVRYYRRINKEMRWFAAVEYSNTDFLLPDSLGGSLVQVIPDFTGRVNGDHNKIKWQVSAVITTVSGKDSSNAISYSFGFGVNLAVKMKLNKKSDLTASFVTGNSIAHFINMFKDKGEDAAYNTHDNKIEGMLSTAGFITYGRNLPWDLTASLSFGMGAISNKSFQKPSDFNYAYNVLLDAFWAPIKGARLGLEYAFGERFDINNERGLANRVSLLMYYDF